MRMNRRAIDKLLLLDDQQLRAVILRLIAESGGNASNFPLSSQDLAKVRHVLRTASDSELAEFVARFKHGGRA